jgi:hypothetical protein
MADVFRNYIACQWVESQTKIFLALPRLENGTGSCGRKSGRFVVQRTFTKFPEPGLVHHSNRGLQYASAEYAAIVEKHRMVPRLFDQPAGINKKPRRSTHQGHERGKIQGLGPTKSRCDEDSHHRRCCPAKTSEGRHRAGNRSGAFFGNVCTRRV